MSTSDNRVPAFYRWLAGISFVGWLVTTYLLLDAEITMRWAHGQYEIHEETALRIATLVWVPIFAVCAGLKALLVHVR